MLDIFLYYYNQNHCIFPPFCCYGDIKLTFKHTTLESILSSRFINSGRFSIGLKRLIKSHICMFISSFFNFYSLSYHLLHWRGSLTQCPENSEAHMTSGGVCSRSFFSTISGFLGFFFFILSRYQKLCCCQMLFKNKTNKQKRLHMMPTPFSCSCNEFCCLTFTCQTTLE